MLSTLTLRLRQLTLFDNVIYYSQVTFGGIVSSFERGFSL